jgi:glycosyltransferase involved in cell wall biosynthesis
MGKKIYIEGTPLFSNSRSGVGQYVKRLTEAMQQLEPENTYTVFGFHFIFKRNLPPDDISPAFARKYIRFVPGRAYNLLYKKIVKLPIDILLRSKPDVVIYGNFAFWPLWTGAKSIVVVHDLGFVDVPEYVETKNRAFLQKFVPYSIKKATHVVTISDHARRRIIDTYGVDPDKISLVPPSVDHSVYYPRKKVEISASRKKYNLPKEYFLFVGTLEPRKNLVGLLDAYAALPAIIQRRYPLVLVGGRGWADDEIQDRLARYKNLPIIRPGYVHDDDLPAVMSGARALLWPTYYEGFGMPPLEAMACGTPVLTSSTTSLPEVVGTDALTVNPADIAEITDGILRLATDDILHANLRTRGIQRARKFTWNKSAQQMLDAINDITS